MNQESRLRRCSATRKCLNQKGFWWAPAPKDSKRLCGCLRRENVSFGRWMRLEERVGGCQRVSAVHPQDAASTSRITARGPWQPGWRQTGGPFFCPHKVKRGVRATVASHGRPSFPRSRSSEEVVARRQQSRRGDFGDVGAAPTRFAHTTSRETAPDDRREGPRSSRASARDGRTPLALNCSGRFSFELWRNAAEVLCVVRVARAGVSSHLRVGAQRPCHIHGAPPIS